ncbi:MAG: hypothetical protein QM642_01675 [Edaphocola sp.]
MHGNNESVPRKGRHYFVNDLDYFGNISILSLWRIAAYLGKTWFAKKDNRNAFSHGNTLLLAHTCAEGVSGIWNKKISDRLLAIFYLRANKHKTTWLCTTNRLGEWGSCLNAGTEA